MAQQIINVGTAPNDGTGDTLKASFTKTNANFTELYAGLAGIPQKLGFSAHKNGTDQAGIPTGLGVFTKVTFGTEAYDFGGYYDPAQSRWTPSAGVVHIDVGIQIQGGWIVAGSQLIALIYKNGALLKRQGTVTYTSVESIQISVDDNASGTDFYEVYLSHNSASVTQIDGLATNTFFNGHVTGGPQGVQGPVGPAAPSWAALLNGFSAHKNGVDQMSLAANVDSKLTFGTELYDQGGYYDTTLHRWTPPAGLIHIDAAAEFYAMSAGNTVFFKIFKNGVVFKQALIPISFSFDQAQISADDTASGSDFYEVYANPSAAAHVRGTTAGITFFNGHLTGGPKGDTGATGAPGAALAAPTTPQGRLTLQAATPVMRTTTSGSNTIRYTPYVGDRIPIYDGTQMVMTGFTELTCLTTDTTKNPAAIGASQVHDWFVWNDAGTLRLSHSVAWATDTARTGTGLNYINGIWVNFNNITNGPNAARGTYVGTTRSNASSTLDWTYGTPAAGGGAAYLNVWNAYNRVDVGTIVQDSTATWTTGAGLAYYLNYSANNRVSFVSGLAEDSPWTCLNQAITTSNSGVAGFVLDAGASPVVSFDSPSGYAASCSTTVHASRAYPPQVGAHYIQACMWGTNGGTVSYNGDSGSSLIGQGLEFEFRM